MIATPKDIVLLHAKLWRERYGKDHFVSWAKDISQTKRLLKVYAPDELASYLRHYCTDYRSSFADRAGHSFNVFIYELPGIIASYTANEAKRGRANQREGDSERLASARAITKGD